MDIETYFCEREPYRSVRSPTALPLPVTREGGQPALEQRVDEIRADLEWDLYRLRLTQFDIQVQDISKAGYPGGETPVTTLCVYVKEKCYLSFNMIRDTLHDTLIKNHLSDLPIEVLSLRQWAAVSRFDIAPDDPAVNPYQSIREALASLVYGALGSQCHQLGLFRVGRRQERSSPAIVCLVQPRTQADWSRLVTDIHQLIGPDLRFKFLPDQQSGGPRYDRDGNPVSQPGTTGYTEEWVIVGQECGPDTTEEVLFR